MRATVTIASRSRGLALHRARQAAAGFPPPRLAPLTRQVGQWVPLAVVGLAGLVLVWTRLIPLERSFFGDEVHSAVAYIQPGPTGAFSHYVPNDHMLWEILTWLITAVTGDHTNAGYRILSVIPAIAATALMTRWLWVRFDAWVAAIFCVLAAQSPQFLGLTTEARGYGLVDLAAVMMLIGADWLYQTGKRRALALFVTGGLLGALTLPTMALPLLATGSALLLKRSLRRQIVITFLIVGVAGAAFYLPVLSGLANGPAQLYGPQLPWYGFLTAPLTDQLTSSIQNLFPGHASQLYQVAAATLLLAGALLLWRRRERFLATAIVWATEFTYLLLEASRLHVHARFGTFLVLPMLFLVSVALVGAGRLLARLRVGAPAVVIAAILFSLFALNKANLELQSQNLPVEDDQDAAQLAIASHSQAVFTNTRSRSQLKYYLGSTALATLPPARLEAEFCHLPTGFVYIERRLLNATTIYQNHSDSPVANTACLRRRGAFEIPLNDRRVPGIGMTVWIIPAVQSQGAAQGGA